MRCRILLLIAFYTCDTTQQQPKPSTWPNPTSRWQVPDIQDFTLPSSHRKLWEFISLVNFYPSLLYSPSTTQQQIVGQWQPIAYLSKTLKLAETHYNAFDREVLAIYLSIKHLHYFLEDRQFHDLTDHKLPLTYALPGKIDHYSPWQARHLDLI